jgi:TatD DNase family protein
MPTVENDNKPGALIDAHNHLQDQRFGDDLTGVLASMRDENIVHNIVNGTCEQDWPKVDSLHKAHPEQISPAFGLHPWKTGARSKEWQEKLRHFLLENPQASIGECGLDLWMRDADINDQIEVLKVHMQLSREFERPLTIHCLKAWPQFIELLESSPPLPNFLLHAFNGPREHVASLCRQGAHFSFSGYFLHPRKQQTMLTFRHIPHDRLLIETDAPDMAPPEIFQGKYHRDNYHHPADLPITLIELAKLRGVSSHQYGDVIRENTARLFRLSDFQ